MEVITFSSTDIVDPVEIIINCFRTFIDFKVKEHPCLHPSSYAGKLPQIIYQGNIIPRHEVLNFLKKAFPIDQSLNYQDQIDTEIYSKNIQNEISSSTDYLMWFQPQSQHLHQKPEYCSGISRLLAFPYYKFYEAKQKLEEKEFLDNFKHIKSNEEAIQRLSVVLTQIENKLGITPFFFINSQGNYQIHSLDIVVYAYVNAALFNLKFLDLQKDFDTKYPRLYNFLLRFDDLINQVLKGGKLPESQQILLFSKPPFMTAGKGKIPVVQNSQIQHPGMIHFLKFHYQTRTKQEIQEEEAEDEQSKEQKQKEITQKQRRSQFITFVGISLIGFYLFRS